MRWDAASGGFVDLRLARRIPLLDFQRQFGRANGAVLDGRDIGTVVFPDAPVKLFVTASAEARALRRHLERFIPRAAPLP